MVQVPCCFCHHYDTPLDFFNPLVLDDPNSELRSDRDSVTPPYSLVQLNFWSFAIMFVLAAVSFNYWLRFRYLNVYSEFQEPPLVKSDAQELHPDVNSPDPPTTFHNYLDDFLQAVRVFGFLEKPVCHPHHFTGTPLTFDKGLSRVGQAFAN